MSLEDRLTRLETLLRLGPDAKVQVIIAVPPDGAEDGPAYEAWAAEHEEQARRTGAIVITFQMDTHDLTKTAER